MHCVRRGRLLILLCLIGLGIAIPGTACSEPVILTFADHHAPDSDFTKLIEAWGKEIEERTDGKVKIVRSVNQNKISVPQTYNAVRGAFIDIGYVSLQNTRGRFPMMDFISLPLGFPSGEVNTAIINEVYAKFKPAELNEVKVLFLHAAGPGYLHTKGKPIVSLDDWRGKKLRSAGVTDEMVTLLGGIPVSMRKSSLQKSIEEGGVDGGFWEFASNHSWKLAEVIDNDIVCDTTSYSLGLAVLMNKEKWESLDANIQRIFDGVGHIWAAKYGELWDQTDTRGLALSKVLKKNIVKIPPAEAEKWRIAVQPVVDNYIALTESKGLPGRAVIDYVEKRISDAKQGKFNRAGK